MNTLQPDVAVIPETEMKAITQNDLRVVLLEAAALNASAAEIRRRMEAGARIEPGKLGAYCDREEEIVDSAPESLTHFGLEVGPVEKIQECGKAFVAHFTEKGCPERLVYGPKEKPAETVAPEPKETYGYHCAMRLEMPLGLDYEVPYFAEVLDTTCQVASDEQVQKDLETLRGIMISCHWLRDAIRSINAMWIGAQSDERPLTPKEVLPIFHRHDAWHLLSDGMYNQKIWQ